MILTSIFSNVQAEMDNAVTSLWMGGEESAASLLIEEIAAKIDMSPNFISGESNQPLKPHPDSRQINQPRTHKWIHGLHKSLK